MRLLKWFYQPERRQTGHSWSSTIREQRGRIERILRDSLRLRRQITAMIEADYQRVRCRASDETGLLLTTCPESCPWTAEQVLDETFWPEKD